MNRPVLAGPAPATVQGGRRRAAGSGSLIQAAPVSTRPSVVVLDYGSGTVRSAVRALERIGADVPLTADPRAATDADADDLVVPGRAPSRPWPTP